MWLGVGVAVLDGVRKESSVRRPSVAQEPKDKSRFSV